MTEVPTPDAEAPEDALLILPADGRTVFRLVRNDPPSQADFQPRYGKKAAAALGITELRRQGLSHWLEIDDVRRENVRDSPIAEVRLEPGRFDFARTGQQKGHLDVWGTKEDFVEFAQVVE